MVYDLAKAAEDSARGGFFLISGSALATVIAAVASIIIGRFLGPELYAQYTLATVVSQLLYLFTDLGISQGVTRFTAMYNSKGQTHRLSHTIRYAMILKTLIGIALFLVNYFFAESLAIVLLQRPDMAFYLRITSVSILFQVIFTTATSAFVGLDKTEYSALTTNIQTLAKTIISIALVLIGLGVAGALIGHVVSYIVAAGASIAALLLMLARVSNSDSHFSGTEDFRSLIRYGAPLYISVLLIGFIPLFQNLVLANYTADVDIGNFKAASNFATLMTVLSIPIGTALLPAFSKIDSSAKQKIRLFFKLANKYTSLIIMPITILMILYSTPIVQIIYGSTYDSAPLFLATYCAVYLLTGLGYLTLMSFYNGLGETKITFIISLVTFAILAILSPPLTMTYGVQGLIATFLLASLAGTIYGVITAKRKFQIEFDTRALSKIYLTSLLSAVPSFLILQFASLPNIATLAVGGVLYLAIYITLVALAGALTQIELQTATEITRKIRLLKVVVIPILKYQQRLMQKKETAEPTQYAR